MNNNTTLVLTALLSSACGQTEAVDKLQDPSIERYSIDLGQHDSFMVGTGTYHEGTPEDGTEGPNVTDIYAMKVAIAGGGTHLHIRMDAEADTVFVKLEGDSGYYSYPAQGDTADVDVYFSPQQSESLELDFANGLSDYCDNGSFQIPDYLQGQTRYTDFYDSISFLLDMLCDGDEFIGANFLSDEEIQIYFPVRTQRELTVWAEKDGETGSPGQTLIDFQDVESGTNQVSLFFDKDTDLDLHVIEPDGNEIFFAERLSESGGELDLDSNPGCSIDQVNNENIYWNNPPAGDYQATMHYWQACLTESVKWTMLYNDGEQLQVAKGSIEASNEDENWSLLNFTIP